MRFLRYAIRRLLLLIPQLLAVSFIVFFLVRLLPGDPAFLMAGQYATKERIEEVRSDHNPRLKVEGVVVNQFQGRANFPQQAVDELIADGLPVLEPYISSSVRIRESHHAARPMVFFESAHKVTAEFEALWEHLRAPRKDRKRAS